MRIARDVLTACAFAGALAAASTPGCGSSGDSGSDGGSEGFGNLFGGGGAGSGALSYLNDGGPIPTCTANGQCVHACSGTGSTTISGTVYDPAGKDPLYGVVVYVPSRPPSAITPGASCYTCQDLYTGGPIAYDVTDASGHFAIPNAPDGTNIPLVVQVGKWRKQLVVPSVAQCANTTMPDKSLTLPKNRAEGDIPSIAIATGGADSLECLLRRVGVDASEYGTASGAGRIHIFQGDSGADTSPAATVASKALWDSKADLMPYDIVLLTCEGHETTGMNQQALFDYAQAGGRVFASHFHYAWFDNGPFGAQNLATWETGTQDYKADPNAVVLTTLPNGQPFPRGVAMQQWLGNVNALTNGELHIVQARHNAVVGAANTASVPWIVTDTQAQPPNETEYFSFDTPFGAPAGQQCGRVVYSDLHVGAASGDYGGYTNGQIPQGAVVPSGCANKDLSPQEKALEFMLFDLSGCITPPGQGAGGVPGQTR